MGNDVFVVIDSDPYSRNAIYHLLSTRKYAFPVEAPDEVQPYWPAEAWVVVRDDGHQLADVLNYLHDKGLYHPIIAYGLTSLDRVCSLLNQGLAGYVTWPDSNGAFLDQVEHCVQQAAHRVKQSRIANEAQHRIRLLSTRERQVIGWMSEGKSNKEIARVLDISPRTVEIHRANALSKLEVESSIVAAVQFRLAHFGENTDEWVIPDRSQTAAGSRSYQVVGA